MFPEKHMFLILIPMMDEQHTVIIIKYESMNQSMSGIICFARKESRRCIQYIYWLLKRHKVAMNLINITWIEEKTNKKYRTFTNQMTNFFLTVFLICFGGSITFFCKFYDQRTNLTKSITNLAYLMTTNKHIYCSKSPNPITIRS